MSDHTGFSVKCPIFDDTQIHIIAESKLFSVSDAQEEKKAPL